MSVYHLQKLAVNLYFELTLYSYILSSNKDCLLKAHLVLSSQMFLVGHQIAWSDQSIAISGEYLVNHNTKPKYGHFKCLCMKRFQYGQKLFLKTERQGPFHSLHP